MVPFLKELLFHVLYVPFHAPFVPPFLRTQHNTHYGCLLDNKPSLRSEIEGVKCSIVPSSLRARPYHPKLEKNGDCVLFHYFMNKCNLCSTVMPGL